MYSGRGQSGRMGGRAASRDSRGALRGTGLCRARAALREKWTGAAKAINDFVFLALGTGIGAGLFLNGRLYRGLISRHERGRRGSPCTHPLDPGGARNGFTALRRALGRAESSRGAFTGSGEGRFTQLRKACLEVLDPREEVGEIQRRSIAAAPEAMIRVALRGAQREGCTIDSGIRT